MTPYSSSSSPKRAGVGPHGGLHAEHVLAQRVGLGPLAHQLPGLVARGRRSGHAGQGIRAASRNPEPNGLRYPSQPLGRAALPRIRAWRSSSSKAAMPLSGTVVPAGNKNAALPVARRVAADRPRRSCSATSRASATWRRCSSCSCDLGVKVEWRDEQRGRAAGRRGHEHRRGPRAGRAHPRLVPARRPAARPLRRGADMPPPGRRRDRPPPPRPAPRRLPRARAPRSSATATSSCRRPTASRPATSSWTSRR